ncbi:hypothetical protein M5K25_026152 [Dendrobium thyrsiflorum]|uniref:Uncharacterized protein n=1 Tax=Dendrobium thyrsiflorum TaxID=117978 RepID=A0ABD0TWK5_DENTH
MLGATAMACLALRRLVYALTPRAAGVPFAGVLIHHLRPPVAACASRHYARMRNRSPPAPKEVESEPESSSSSSDEEELMDPYREDDLESEELDCFVLDFGAGEKEEEKRGGEEDA